MNLADRLPAGLRATGQGLFAIGLGLLNVPVLVVWVAGLLLSSKYINNIFSKLGMPPSDDDNRRVLAGLRYLDA